MAGSKAEDHCSPSSQLQSLPVHEYGSSFHTRSLFLARGEKARRASATEHWAMLVASHSHQQLCLHVSEGRRGWNSSTPALPVLRVYKQWLKVRPGIVSHQHRTGHSSRRRFSSVKSHPEQRSVLSLDEPFSAAPTACARCTPQPSANPPETGPESHPAHPHTHKPCRMQNTLHGKPLDRSGCSYPLGGHSSPVRSVCRDSSQTKTCQHRVCVPWQPNPHHRAQCSSELSTGRTGPWVRVCISTARAV